MIQKGKLTKIVGAGNVSDDPVVLEEYSSDVSFANRIRPVCVVKPADGRQIQKLVNLANETQTPLVPVSSGPPRFHGDTVPDRGGAIVDFSKMKHVIKIDRTSRYAMLEPGVTYGELIPLLREQGLKLVTPLLPRASESRSESRAETGIPMLVARNREVRKRRIAGIGGLYHLRLGATRRSKP